MGFVDTTLDFLGLTKLQQPLAQKNVLGGMEGGTLSTLLNTSLSPKRGTYEILQAYNTMPYFRATVHKIASNCAAVPLRAYTKTQNGRAIRSRKHQDATIKSKVWQKNLIDYEELQELEDHPLVTVLSSPNDMMTGRTLKQLTFSWLLVVGEAFWWHRANAFGMPEQVMPIPPHWVRQVPTEQRPWYEIKFGSKWFKVPVDEITWFKDPSLLNPYGRGSGIGMSLGDELDTDENAAAYVSGFFYNRALPSMIVSIAEADEDQLKATKAKFENEYRGALSAYRTAWTQGEVSVERLDTSFSDMELIDLRQFERDVVIQTFGLSPEMLGVLDDSNRATAQEARAMFAENVLIPWLDTFDCELQRLFAPLFDERIIVKHDDPTPDDREFTLRVSEVHPWAFSYGQIQQLAGQPMPEQNAELHIVPLGVQATEDLSSVGLVEEPDEPEPPPNTVPPSEPEQRGFVRKTLTGSEIDDILQSLTARRLNGELNPLARELMEQMGVDEAQRVGAAGSFNMLNPLVTEYLEEFALERMGGMVNEFTKDQLRAALIEGVEAGESIRQIADRVRGVFGDANRVRATRIAQTEVLGIANRATYAAQRMSGVVQQRRWVTSFVRSRATHQGMDGQIVGIEEQFESPSGATTLHPGGFGDGSEDINCKCTTVAVLSDEPRSQNDLEIIWRDFEAITTDYQSRFERATKRAFAAQREDVLEALEEYA